MKQHPKTQLSSNPDPPEANSLKISATCFLPPPEPACSEFTEPTEGSLLRASFSILLVSFSLLTAATLTVPTEYPTIQAGVDAAENGDTVLVLDGEYTGEGNYDIEILHKGIVFISESGPENCIINPQGQGRGVNIHSFIDIIINGFTINNGFADYGGGINMLGNFHTINNCIFSNNIALEEGGAVAATMADPIFNNCIFYGNQAPVGAGISPGGWAEVYIFNSIIFDAVYSGQEGGPHASHCLHPPEYLGSLWFSQDHILADPLFIDPENGNFHLQLQSPCINAGTIDMPFFNNENYFSLDPDSTQPDIGPFYFHLELKGDVSFDENIDVQDILIIVNIILGESESFNAQIWAADFNADGVINVIDIMHIVNLILEQCN